MKSNINKLIKENYKYFAIVIIIGLGSFGCDLKQDTKAIGLQLYSLRDDIRVHGIEHVLKKVSLMGYSKLELAGYNEGRFYGYTPADFKSLTETYNLEVISSHVVRKMSDDLNADMVFWKKAIDDHASLGVKYLIMPILPNKNAYPFVDNEPITIEDIDETCAYFNRIGKIAAESGLRFGFHNHGHEHKILVEGKSVYDHMLQKLNEQYVFMQLDVYWVKEGGYDPIMYLKQFAGRFPLFHIKDETAVGASGQTDFKPIFEAAYAQGLKEYFVEVEEYIATPMEDVEKSFDYLNMADYVR